MTMKSMCYSSCCFSKELYRKLWQNDMTHAPAQSIQKYHRLLSEGFCDCGINVNMISYLSLPKEYLEEYSVGKIEKKEPGIRFYYLPFSKNRLFKHLSVILNAYKTTRQLLKNGSDFTVGDTLNASVTLGSLLATKKEKKPFISIVTDLPGMLSKRNFSFDRCISEYILEKSDGFIVLTEAMNDVVNKKMKPYVVIEGQVDGRADWLNEKVSKNDKFTIMYAGRVDKENGMDYLGDGFIKTGIPNSELHIYGNGPYADEVSKIAQENSAIMFHGECINDEVIKAEREATLLVNPRPTTQEFTRYSFPCKIMEYMLSGTPVLTTNLPGMPREYLDYVYLIDKENSEGMTQALQKLSRMSRDELSLKGLEARKFVVNNKNSKIQAKRILDEVVAKCLSDGA